MLKAIDRYHHHRTDKHGHVVPHLVEMVEYGGASYLFGYLQNRLGERASVMGVPADLLAGVVLKGAALAGDLMGASGGLSALANNVGNAGIGAFFHTLGAGHGSKSAGLKRVLVHESDVPKVKAAIPTATILGAIGKPPHGDFLSPAQLAALAR